MISPIDIKQQSFSKAMRGYNTEDVRAFLQSLAAEWETVQAENKELKTELEKAEDRLKSYTDMEDIMRKALYQAEQSSKATLDSAKRDADLKIVEAEQQAKQIVADAQLERKREEAKIQELMEKKAELVGQLKAFLKSELDHISHYQENIIQRTQASPAPIAATPVAKPVVATEAVEVIKATEEPVAEAPIGMPKAPTTPSPEPEMPAPKVVVPTPKPAPVIEPMAKPEIAEPVATESKPLPKAKTATKQQSFFDRIDAENQNSAIISELSKGL